MEVNDTNALLQSHKCILERRRPTMISHLPWVKLSIKNSNATFSNEHKAVDNKPSQIPNNMLNE